MEKPPYENLKALQESELMGPVILLVSFKLQNSSNTAEN